MIKAFCGDVGSGKTLSMIYEVLPWVKRDFRIVANLPISSRVWKQNGVREILRTKRLGEMVLRKAEVIEKWETFFNQFITSTNTIFLMDEAGAWFSNYSWKLVPDEVYNRFFQHRKYNVHLLYTTQDFGFVAKKLREMTNIVAECEAPLRFPADKSVPYSQGTPIIVRNVLYKPLYYTQNSYSIESEKKFIKGRKFIFSGGLREAFEAYDTKKDVSKGI